MLMIGVPAKQICWMSEYGEKLDLSLEGVAETVCSYAGQHYKLNNKQVIVEKVQ